MSKLDKIIQDSYKHLEKVANNSFEKITEPQKSSDNLIDKLEYLKDFFTVLDDKVLKDISAKLLYEGNLILDKYRNDLSDEEYNQLKEKLSSACTNILQDKISKFNSKLK
jgi:hypothetical protein